MLGVVTKIQPKATIKPTYTFDKGIFFKNHMTATSLPDRHMVAAWSGLGKHHGLG